jgi:tetratricopeptide (TPR) repeat protein
MADDLLGGVLGGEEEQPETEAPQALAGAEAFASATAAIESRQDPGVARKTEAFLTEQTLLLETQRRHLEEEHASRLTHLRLTLAAARRKRFADHMRNCLYACIALLALGIVIAAIRMTVEAMSDHSLVVEDFTVPADLAARGYSSQALAEDLASRVAVIRATATRNSITRSNDVRATQADILKVEIPETGISINELARFLHRWLGHQTVLSGQLREEVGGQISIVLHVAGADPIVVRGSSADLDRLMQTTAENAFEVFDPVNYVIYLIATGRNVEAYDAAARFVRSPIQAAMSRRDRANVYTLLAITDPDMRRGLSSALLSIDIDPLVLTTWMTAAQASARLGHDHAALNFWRRMLGTKRQDQPPQQRDAYPGLLARAHFNIDQATGDFASLDGDYEASALKPQQLRDDYAQRAVIAADLHEVARSEHELALAHAAGAPELAVLEAQWSVSSGAGDWPQALATAKALVADTEAQAQKAAAPGPEWTGVQELALGTQYRPLLAYAEAMTGDTASAIALISQTPTDCYLCVRTRAKIAAAAAEAAAGDPAAAASDVSTADRWFAEAVRQAPDLPIAYFEWGQALLARGDLAGAAREFSLAHAKGPHFADPLKGWGDVLVKQGHAKESLAKYDEALRDAPNWPALHAARDAAAAAHNAPAASSATAAAARRA